jgi:hypothetical protein
LGKNTVTEMENWPSAASIGSTTIFSLPPRGAERVIVTHPPRDWYREIILSLNSLTELERGWDGYGAPAVKFDTANFALQMLERICGETAPAPQIVPGNHGDLQIEWHTDNGTIELHVQRPNRVQGWYFATETGDNGIEVNFTSDFTEAAQWVKKVTEPVFADLAAA